jgi:hypothetical protein
MGLLLRAKTEAKTIKKSGQGIKIGFTTVCKKCRQKTKPFKKKPALASSAQNHNFSRQITHICRSWLAESLAIDHFQSENFPTFFYALAYLALAASVTRLGEFSPIG